MTTQHTLHLRAFNMTEGAAFVTIDQDTKAITGTWIATFVSRNAETEIVVVTARRVDNQEEIWPDTMVRTFTRSFNTVFYVVGHCINPADVSDFDFGTN